MTLENVPEWLTSWEKFRREYNESLKEQIGLDAVSNNGGGVDIAVVDTAYTAEGIEKDISVGNSEDFSEIGDETHKEYSHGTRVLSVLSAIIPNAEYYIYRVKAARKLVYDSAGQRDQTDIDLSNSSGEANKRILLAIEQAIEDEVDIINLSCGVFHASCENCVFEKAIEEAHRAGIIVVSAIGNESERRGDHVLCPALSDGSLSVGGMVNYCNADFEHHTSDRRIWADVRTPESGITRQGPFCSTQGCAPGYDCDENCDQKWWDGNIRHFGGNPQVLAPAHRPEIRYGRLVVFSPGTSFATPITAGTIGRILASDRATDHDVEQVKQALLQSGTEISNGDGASATSINAEGALSTINEIHQEDD